MKIILSADQLLKIKAVLNKFINIFILLFILYFSSHLIYYFIR
jgi:hypothetical protein